MHYVGVYGHKYPDIECVHVREFKDAGDYIEKLTSSVNFRGVCLIIVRN